MILISGQRFNNQLRSTQNNGFLLSCIGEKVTIETDFYYEDITYRNPGNEIILKPAESDVDLTDTTGIIWSKDEIAFTDTMIGDTIGVWNGGVFAYYTVTQKITNGLIRTTYAGAYTLLANGDYIFNCTPQAGVRYAWNLLESGSDFNSKIDGEFQQAEIATADCTNTSSQPMTFKGKLSYQNGSVNYKGIAGSGGSLGNYEQQSFTIVHEVIITPMFLFDQWEDLILGISPDYYQAEKCLNYISQIQLGRHLNNPNGFQTYDVSTLQANIGWFNERFNGGKTNYSITSVVIKDGTTTIDDLRFGKDITVEIIIGNTTDSPFSNGNTQWIFGFNYLPETEANYKDNGRDFEDNFLHDTTKDVIGATENGANNGNSMQVVKNVVSTHISSTSTKLTATINVGADAEDILKEGSYSRYMLWIITENHSLSDELSDKVNLLAHVGEFDKELTTTNLIDASHTFIRHPFTNANTMDLETTNFQMFPVDDVAVQTDFSIDFTGHTTEGIVIKKIINRLTLSHSTEADITLEEVTVDVSNSLFVDGYVQEINFSQDRVFKTNQGIRKTITVVRNSSLDSGLVKNWQINYPFMNRWEYWAALQIINPAAGIFDSTEDLNGLNHFWNRLANVAGWTMNFETEFQIEQNGEDFSQVFTTPISSSNFNSGVEWDNEFIKTYDSTGVTEQTSGGNKYISGYSDTWVKASFEKISGLVPSVDNVDIVIWIETFESGGVSDIRHISSNEDVASNSWFKSVDTSNRVKITKTGSTFVGEVLIDYTKFSVTSQYTMYARIYDRTGGCDVDSITNLDGVCITDLDGASILDL